MQKAKEYLQNVESDVREGKEINPEYGLDEYKAKLAKVGQH